MPLTRRKLLAATPAGVLASAAFVAAPLVSQADPPQAAEKAIAPRTRRLRIAHLTDIHVQPERAAAKGLAACFDHVQSLPARLGYDAANMIITGGDTIMDAFEADMARTTLQWELWRTVKADRCSMEIHRVIGNHDIWGWGKQAAKTTGNDPLDGKQWACDEFGREKSFTSFDRAGWHIVLLDSIFPLAKTYIGKIDDAQWDWLETDLAAVAPSTHVALFSHIPILSAVPLTLLAPPAIGASMPTFAVQGGSVHVDVDRFQKLFARRRNIKVCVSGHLHVVEQIDYQGVRYLCNGAVSAGWWKGKNRDTDFGYALVDLFDDGSVERQYVPYGWTAVT